MSRPLLPNLRSPSSTSPISSGDPPHPHGQSKPTYAKRGKITIVACVPCRKRKTKCDGRRPQCGQCAAREGQCAYDMTDEQRKLTYLRDQSDQLQEKQQALELLISSLQTWDIEDAQGLFRRLRNGEQAQPLADQIRAGQWSSDDSGKQSSMQSWSHPPPKSLPGEQDQSRSQDCDRLMELLRTCRADVADEALQRLRREEDIGNILRLVELRDPKLESLESEPNEQFRNLEAGWQHERSFGLQNDMGTTSSQNRTGQMWQGSWSTVTNNEELIEHLLDLYFTWQHGFFQNFPEDLFREDKKSGGTKYCSSALVNAICASGCYLSHRKELQEDRDNDQVLISGFFNETMRILNESHAPSLPTTAATYLVSYVEGYRGNSAGQWMLGGRSALMALDLHLHLRATNKRVQKSGTTEERREVEKELLARSIAFWGCFHVMQINSFTLGRLPLFSSHSIAVDLPQLIRKDDERPWVAPEENGRNGDKHRPGARSSTFRQCASLSMIVNATQLMFYAPSEPLTGARLVTDYEKYETWYRDLPEMVKETRQAPPHVLCLQYVTAHPTDATYRNKFRIGTYQLTKRNSMYYHSAVLLLFRPFLRARVTNTDIVPRDICRNAANAISSIWSEHRSLYGLSGIWQFQVNCLLIASTIHIVNLPAITPTNWLAQACDTFQELVRWHGWAKSAIESLRNLVVEWNLVLPQEAEAALYRDLGGLRHSGSSIVAKTQQHSPHPFYMQDASQHRIGPSEQYDTEMTHALPPQSSESLRDPATSERRGAALQPPRKSQHPTSGQSVRSGRSPDTLSNPSRLGKRQSLSSTATSIQQSAQGPDRHQQRQHVFSPKHRQHLHTSSQPHERASTGQIPSLQSYERSRGTASGPPTFNPTQQPANEDSTMASGSVSAPLPSTDTSARRSSYVVPQPPPQYQQGPWSQQQYPTELLTQHSMHPSYMYNPYPMAQAPMLIPANMARDQRQLQQQHHQQQFSSYPHDAMMGQEPGGAQRHANASASEQGSATGTNPYGSQWEASFPLPDVVEGLSFADDWRGPPLPFSRPTSDGDDDGGRR